MMYYDIFVKMEPKKMSYGKSGLGSSVKTSIKLFLLARFDKWKSLFGCGKNSQNSVIFGLIRQIAYRVNHWIACKTRRQIKKCIKQLTMKNRLGILCESMMRHAVSQQYVTVPATKFGENATRSS